MGREAGQRIGRNMRCLAVADLHYSLPQFDWLLDASALFDVVVLAGDALEVGSLVDFQAQSLVVRKYIERMAERTRVVVCSGNHDLDGRSTQGEKIARWVGDLRQLGVACDGDSLMVGETLFTVCPWWDGPLVLADIGRQLDKAALSRATRWVWAHHAPPSDSPTSWGGSRHLGDVELRGWIERFRPDIVLSGHVHQSPFVRDGSWYDRVGECWVFNAGHQFGRPPACLVLEFEREAVYWLSAAGQQVVRLAEPLHRPAATVTEPPGWLTALGRLADPIQARHPSPAD